MTQKSFCSSDTVRKKKKKQAFHRLEETLTYKNHFASFLSFTRLTANGTPLKCVEVKL